MTEQTFEHDDEISLLDILVTLAESWKLLVFGPLIAGVLAGALSFLWPKTYESVAIVRMSEAELALLNAAPVLDPLIAKFGLLPEFDGIQEDGYSTTITQSGDPRIARSGVIFRKTKLDELPQLWNVLVGDMSFVGPRPDVPGYADRLEEKIQNVLLSVRPGITGPASLAYRNEEELLSDQSDPKRYNDEVIYPDKVRINLDYIANWRFTTDIKYIFKTIVG